MSQLATQVSDQADVQGGAQGEAQVVDQQAQTAVVEGQQQQSAVDGEGARVLFSNFDGLGVGNDFNKVISMAKQFQELDRDGYSSLAASAREKGMDGHQLTSYFRSQGAGGLQAQQAAAEVQDVQQQAQAGVQQGVFTREEAMQMVTQAVQESEDRWSRKQSDADSESEYKRLQGLESDARTAELTALGYTRTPQKVNIMGTDHELDPMHRFILNPALEAMTQFLIDQGLNPNDPDYQSKRGQPASADQVRQAGQALKPFLSSIGQQAIEDAADSTEHHPAASQGAGPGGRREDTSSEPATPDEMRKRIIASTEAKRVRAMQGVAIG